MKITPAPLSPVEGEGYREGAFSHKTAGNSKPGEPAAPAITPEEKKAILRLRARILAQETEEPGVDEEYLVALEFLLAHERYAIETRFIREVYPMMELTPLPCTPAFVCGISNIRGRIITIIDIKKFLDLPDQGIANLNKVILVKKDLMEIGILADEIIDIRTISMNGIQAIPLTMSGANTDYLKGVTSEGLIFLDMERLLTDERLIVHEEVEE